MKAIVITRPHEDAQRLAVSLTEKGFTTLIEPMLAIQPMYEQEKTLTYALERKPQAILVTSKHAVMTLARMSSTRHIPIIAVGRATAHYALDLGFRLVAVAGGTASSLITYVQSHCKADGAGLLYVRGSDISTDIAAKLMREHFRVESVTLYRARAAKRFSPALKKALENKEVEAVMFFSQRTAATYAALTEGYGLGEAHRTVSLVCMSKAIAAKLTALPCKKTLIAARPNAAAMLDKVNSL